VRNNPCFDAEERHFKLEVARSVRLLLEKAQAGGEWPSLLDAILLRHSERYYFPRWMECEWLNAWAAADSESLRQALCGFLNPRLEPDERFDQFVEAADRAARGRKGAILSFGSLFNFAQAPHTLPIMRAAAFERCESLLGSEMRSPASLTEQYRHHLRFARQVQELLGHETLVIRDMLDVQGLIFAASREQFSTWPYDEEAAKQARPQTDKSEQCAEPGTYLSAFTIYRNHAPYLREWIEFHRLVGVEHFFLYDNGSTDDHLDVLAPYLADGSVTLHDHRFFPPQYPGYRRCIREHRYESRWIAFIDIDEFLFCPSGLLLPDVLVAYEQAPAVGVNGVVIGTSGHHSRPDGLVIENYVEVVEEARTIKSIVDPRRVVDLLTPHHFRYSDGLAVDENQYPITGPATTYASMARLRINHYHTKSREELRAKYAMPRPDTGNMRPDRQVDRVLKWQERYGRPDAAILRFAPAVREALDRVPGSRSHRRSVPAGSWSSPRPNTQMGTVSSSRG
jgi:hypothetical protein